MEIKGSPGIWELVRREQKRKEKKSMRPLNFREQRAELHLSNLERESEPGLEVGTRDTRQRRQILWIPEKEALGAGKGRDSEVGQKPLDSRSLRQTLL